MRTWAIGCPPLHMRHHPDFPRFTGTRSLQFYRAIGFVRGQYVSDPTRASPSACDTAANDGTRSKPLLLVRVLSLVRPPPRHGTSPILWRRLPTSAAKPTTSTSRRWRLEPSTLDSPTAAEPVETRRKSAQATAYENFRGRRGLLSPSRRVDLHPT